MLQLKTHCARSAFLRHGHRRLRTSNLSTAYLRYQSSLGNTTPPLTISRSHRHERQRHQLADQASSWSAVPASSEEEYLSCKEIYYMQSTLARLAVISSFTFECIRPYVSNPPSRQTAVARSQISGRLALFSTSSLAFPARATGLISSNNDAWRSCHCC